MTTEPSKLGSKSVVACKSMGGGASILLLADGGIEVCGALQVTRRGSSNIRLSREQVAQLMRLLSGCTVSL